ncbi:MAG: tetratricopeptide repeat protein [Desulfobacterium sp.]|nr:tetratricopeptide repeat protein [Desulfobacterium sp.]
MENRDKISTDPAVAVGPGTRFPFNFATAGSLIILVLAVAVYANSIGNGFSNWDDPDLIVENRSITTMTYENIKTIFTPKSGATFQPVRLLSYMIDYYFWELDPRGYHFHNIILHSMAGMLLFLSLLRMIPRIAERCGGEGLKKSNIQWTALFTALIFISHPVNVESVTWLSSRKYCLLAFFTFLSLYFFVRSSEDNRYHPVFLSLGFFSFAAAVLSSPFGVVIPGLFFLYDYCRDKSNNPVLVLKRRIIYHLPYLIAGTAAVWLLVKILVLAPSGGAAAEHYMGNPSNTFYTMLRVLFDYARNLFLPFWLNNRYVDYISLSPLELKVLISLFSLFTLLGTCVYLTVKGRKFTLFCVGWFLIFWVPVSNIIPISTKMADRYLYLAASGIWLLVIHLFISKAVFKKDAVLRWMPHAIIGGLVICFSLLSCQRNFIWSDSISLWSDSLEKDYENTIAHYNLGYALDLKGQAKKAIFHYNEAIRIDPDHYKAHVNIAILLFEAKKHGQAENHLENALKINPRYSDAWKNFGIMRFRTGDFPGAVTALSQCLLLTPEDAAGHYNIGVVLFNLGDYRKAANHFLEAVRIDPAYAGAHNNLGAAYYALGENTKAIHHYRTALNLDPGLLDAKKNLTAILGETIK